MTPGPADGSGAAFLRALIAREGGWISVERFMREALYHPSYGYYSRRVRAVGRTGDFATSATLHPALGQAVAAWAAAHRRTVRHAGRWHLIELGGGSGEMAAAVLGALGWWAGRGLQYHLVEISEGLRAEQARRLGGSQRVSWHKEIQSALRAAGGQALIFSNEFVDAFPCVQLAREAASGHWREAGLRWSEGEARPAEGFAEWRGPEPDFTLAAPAPGQRVEIHRAYRGWLAGWVEEWRQGRLLTIDYGGVPPALYRRRPHGTLRAYCRHLRLTGPEVFERFGQQDVTADVNFADLQAWSRELGLEQGRLGTQAEFLRRWTPRRTPARAENDATLAQLLDPAGAGGAFQVLEQMRPGQNAA